MRISDWSSDVCSSDLPADDQRCHLVGGDRDHRLVQQRYALRRLAGADQGPPLGVTGEGEQVRVAETLRDRRDLVQQRERDRKSGVSAKGVPVRVKLGGRRIVKKKRER